MPQPERKHKEIRMVAQPDSPWYENHGLVREGAVVVCMCACLVFTHGCTAGQSLSSIKRLDSPRAGCRSPASAERRALLRLGTSMPKRRAVAAAGPV